MVGTPEDDPLIDQRRRDCVAHVATWLRRHDRASVLSLASWDPSGRHSGGPDRAYDAVAVEIDLDAAVDRLPKLQRVACLTSKTVDREEKGWFRRQVWPAMMKLCGMEWVEWTHWVEEHHGREARPYELLLQDAADRIVELLGPHWWPPPRPRRTP